MIFKKKGQAAMEFLMTYGWALLVVLIAIAALAFFGLLNPSRFLPEKCEIAPGLTCMDFTANSENLTILLNNGLGTRLQDLTINATNCNTVGGNISSPANISEGQTVKFEFGCEDVSTYSGTRFKSDLEIDYTTVIEGNSLTHSKTGFLVVEVQ